MSRLIAVVLLSLVFAAISVTTPARLAHADEGEERWR